MTITTSDIINKCNNSQIIIILWAVAAVNVECGAAQLYESCRSIYGGGLMCIVGLHCWTVLLCSTVLGSA